MYMTRHLSQLPVSIEEISKAEMIPHSYLSRVFKKLVNAGFVKSQGTRGKGYTFVIPPGQISLLELFKVVEDQDFLTGCFMNHCECGGTPENCEIYSIWKESTVKLMELLKQTSLVDATWNHPEHRFGVPAAKQ